jgi:hypothetical protein
MSAELKRVKKQVATLKSNNNKLTMELKAAKAKDKKKTV